MTDDYLYQLIHVMNDNDFLVVFFLWQKKSILASMKSIVQRTKSIIQ